MTLRSTLAVIVPMLACSCGPAIVEGVRFALGAAAIAATPRNEPGTVVQSIRTFVTNEAEVVEIVSNRDLVFTSFWLADPPRFVIDIPNGIPEQVPEEIAGSNGLIAQVRTAHYGDESKSMTRVLIRFTRDVEAKVTQNADAQAHALVVKVVPK